MAWSTGGGLHSSAPGLAAVDDEAENILRWSSRSMARSDGSFALEKLWLVLLVSTAWLPSLEAQSPTSVTAACPLNFTVLNQFPSLANTVKSGTDLQSQCAAVNSGRVVVMSAYLRESGFFLVPNGTSTACTNAYQSQLQSQGATRFNISSNCPSSAAFPERGTDVCRNIQSAQNFSNLVPANQLQLLNSSCSQNLAPATTCGPCNQAVASLTLSPVRGSSSNESCIYFGAEYTAGIINDDGPLNPATAFCLLYVSFPDGGHGRKKNLKYIGVGVGGMLLICFVGALIFYTRYRHIIAANREARKKRARDLLKDSSVPARSINWFDIDELKGATRNFSRDNILGTGGYGNVYKGTLLDGSVVAIKRFKNCAPSGDADFVHEVEMISSVRHRHLVGIRGCCVASSEVTGVHQRIIVYDYMPNGSLLDHLFSTKSGMSPLDWPTRSKIAIGMARGLEYLHHDALPAIFHRDIKPGNILLDKDFNALLADFGLAKFTPEGVSHLTTKAAGTHGYVAPEYAIYGQLTEKSDVYSFGMVVLELVSGRKALLPPLHDGPPTLLSDWAWILVRQGRWKSIVDPKLGVDGGFGDQMERFILVGLLCAHPQMFYRPSIDQALKMLECNAASGLPVVPNRPLPLTSTEAEIREALSKESREPQDRSSMMGFSSYSVNSSNSASSEAETHPVLFSSRENAGNGWPRAGDMNNYTDRSFLVP